MKTHEVKPQRAAGLSRRSLLGAPAAAGAAAVLGGSGAHGRESAPSPAGRFDFADPRDNVEALVRVKGDASGAPTYLWAKGALNLVPTGGEPIHIAHFEVCRISKFERIEPGRYTHRYWSGLFVTDKDRGGAIERFVNPLNGHEGAPTYRYGGPTRSIMGPEGLRYPGPDGEISDANPLSNDGLNPFILPWRWVHDAGWVDYTTVFDMFGQPFIDASEMRFSMSALEADGATSVRCLYSYAGESPLYPWLGMTPEEGFLYWAATGRKAYRPQDIPQSLRALFDEYHPGLLDDPERFTERDSRGRE